MSNDSYNKNFALTDKSNSSPSGCSSPEEEPLKRIIAFKMGKSVEQTRKELLTLATDKKLNIRERNLSIQGLSACPGDEAEVALIGLLEEQLHPTQKLSVLKTLGEIGTEKSIRALDKLKLSDSKPEIRQYQFARLLIMSRYQITIGADILLKELTESPGRRRSYESIPLKMDLLDKKITHQHVTQMQGHRYGVALSNNLGFSIDAGNQKLSFLFNHTLDDPAAWDTFLDKQQILGLVAKQSKMGYRIYQKYIVLSTPAKDHTLISLFRSNGELFMQAKLSKEAGLFNLTNVEEGSTKDKIERSLGNGRSISLELTYLRTGRKRKAVQDIA